MSKPKLIKLTRKTCSNCSKLDMFMSIGKQAPHKDIFTPVVEDTDLEKFNKYRALVPDARTLPIILEELEDGTVKLLSTGFNPKEILGIVAKYSGN